MWYILPSELNKRNGELRFLEIGVYKGQVISLWSLLKRKLNMQAKTFCITPDEWKFIQKSAAE